MTPPLFSVVMPAYNSEQTIKAAIRSVLAQEHGDLELIVVDDGSTDATAEVVKSVSDPRMRYKWCENGGVSAARNLGVDEARGDLVAFLDSDDEALPGWLSAFAAMLSDERVVVAFCGLLAVSAEVSAKQILPRKNPRLESAASCLFLSGCYAVRRPFLQKVGGFDTRFRYSENTEIGVRLMAACADEGLITAAAQTPLVKWNRPTRGRHTSRKRLEYQIESCSLLFDKHPRVFWDDRETAAAFLAVAGVASVRLGRLAEARRFFLRAIRRRPFGPSNYARLLLATNRRSARRAWGPPTSK
jgi:glycosyltransferase involved in cell wall biosynthesis